jgi:adenosylcobinamide-GDP ribazoletransferase
VTGVAGSSPRTGNPVVHEVRLLLTAVSFLTRIPSPSWVRSTTEDLKGSTLYFPLVGLGVGLAAGAVYAGAALVWPPWLAVTLAMAGSVWLTGAFHEDALADSLDGFGGGWDREQVLAIMKDSRIGAYGTLGLVFAVLVKFAALVTVAAGGPLAVMRALIAGHILSRWSSLPLIWQYRYVRAEARDARSKPFAASVTGRRLAVGSGLTAILVGLTLGGRAPVALAAALVVTLLAGRYFHRRLGGITGDCLGAANQCVELAVYLMLTAGQPGP